MGGLVKQTRADRGVDLVNLNAIVQLLNSGDYIVVGPGLNKSVLGGKVTISLPGEQKRRRTPFEVFRVGRTKVRVAEGRLYFNGRGIVVPESADITITAECYLRLSWDVSGLDSAILSSVTALTSPNMVPDWEHGRRYRNIAKITWLEGGIDEIEDWRGDIHVDDVLPRPAGEDAEQDYRVPIFNKTGWGDDVPAGGIGHVANIVRMTSGDPE